MKIEEYLSKLPQNILSGNDVQLSEKTLREIFDFAKLGEDDIFYHLGCGDEKGISIALKEYKVKNAIGIDIDELKIKEASKKLEKNLQCELRCEDIQYSDISDATVILFWFTDEKIIQNMIKKFEDLDQDTKIITIWGPLPDCMPDQVKFPYIVNKVPFRKARDLQEQVLAVFGVKCISFVTAWEFAERYTKAIGTSIENDRFLTIIQTLTIWINAKNLGVACGNDVPESIRTYIGIMKTHYDLDFDHLLD